MPKLSHKFKDTKAVHQTILKLNRTLSSLGGLPPTAKQIAGDVIKLYPSVDNNDGVPAVRKMLEQFPNPDGLPTELIIEALKICLEENVLRVNYMHIKSTVDFPSL